MRVRVSKISNQKEILKEEVSSCLSSMKNLTSTPVLSGKEVIKIEKQLHLINKLIKILPSVELFKMLKTNVDFNLQIQSILIESLKLSTASQDTEISTFAQNMVDYLLSLEGDDAIRRLKVLE